jgi:hypothetical protein
MSFLKKIIDHIENKKFIAYEKAKREDEREDFYRKEVLYALEKKEILQKKLCELQRNSLNVSLAEIEEIESELRENENYIDGYGFDFGIGKRWEEYAKNRITSPKYRW